MQVTTFITIPQLQPMLTDITNALVRAINDHPETAITGLVGIVGTVVGGLFKVAWDWFGRQGLIRFSPIHGWIRPLAQDGFGQHVLKPVSEATDVEFWFELRVLNTFPVPKSLALLSADFRAGKSMYLAGTSVLSCTELTMALQGDRLAKQDLELPAAGFTRVYVKGWVKANSDVLSSCRLLHLVFLVAPKERADFWHKVTFATKD
jgi:hypothetical protein